MADFKFNGLGVAMVTPFKKDLSIDYDAIERLIEHVIEGGSDYIVALGTTAETPTLSAQEKEDVARFISLKTACRIPLVIGIGGNNTDAVVKEIQKRDLSGYSAILSVVPYYNKPTQEGIYRHFMAIAENSPLPIILYNVPGRTGVNMTAHTVCRLSMASDKFIAIKEASAKLDQCKEIAEDCREGFKVISGNDADVAPIMQFGGCGVISVLGNAFPQPMKKLIDLCNHGDFEEAAYFQSSIEEIIGRLFEDGNPAGVKAMLKELSIAENILRLPLVPVRGSLEARLRKDVKLLKHQFPHSPNK